MILVPDCSGSELEGLLDCVYGVERERWTDPALPSILHMLGVAGLGESLYSELDTNSAAHTVLTLSLPVTGRAGEDGGANLCLADNKDITIIQMESEEPSQPEADHDVRPSLHAETKPSQEKLKCEICGKKFGSIKKLDLHKVRTHHPDKKSDFR